MGSDCVTRRTNEDSTGPQPLALLLPNRMRLATLALTLLCAAAALRAQVPATWVPGNVETRSHDYDLVHQRIELRDISWDSTSLNGRVMTTLAARRAALDSVILDAACGHLDSPRDRRGGTHASHDPRRRHARRASRQAAPLRRHHALHPRLPRAHRQRTRSHLHLRRRPAASTAATLEHGRDHRQQRVVSHVRLSERQGKLGGDRHRSRTR